MGMRINRVRAEWEAFLAEVFRENAPRYKRPSEWPHLWVDFWVSFFGMSYTLGHVAGVGVPVAIALALLC